MSRSRSAIIAGILLTLAAVILGAVWPGAAQAATVIEQVSLTYDDDTPIGNCSPDGISQDGRYVLFYTMAYNVVPNDTNDVGDMFVRDRLTGTTERVSVSSSEVEANEWSNGGYLSTDGRYVAFQSKADNLADGGDTNGEYDVFVRDRVNGTTIQVSVSSGGTKGNDTSHVAAMSANGRYVVFSSDATNLVAGDTNVHMDVFIRDLVDQTTTRVSVRSDGTQGNGDSTSAAVSDDGRYVAFSSTASNLVTGDTNGVTDVFVRDMQTGTIERVSVSSAEAQANDENWYPSISADGRYVAFESSATALVTGDSNGASDVFVRDRTAGTTERVSVSSAEAQATGASSGVAISADGRYAAFQSDAANLVAGDTNAMTDVFVRDRTAGTTKRVSLAYDGAQPNAACGGACISADGRFIAFDSEAYNLTTVDTNGWWQAFLVRNPGTVAYVSIRGVDRFDTAIKISQAMFPGVLPDDSGVVLVPGYSFQEALCGAPLAAAYGGPVLLNSTSILYSTVEAELKRLAPDHIFCIGLGAAVESAVHTALPAANVHTIDLSNVYEMSRAVANALKKRAGDMSLAIALVTIGTNFPDAIGLAPLACSKLWPIILTDQVLGGTPLHAEAVAALTELGVYQALKVGTYSDLPPGIKGAGNCSGSDRYVTNANVAKWADTTAGLGFNDVAFATGDKYPDALAAGPYLVEGGGILLLSPLTGPVPNVIATLLSAHAADVFRLTFIACIEPVISQVKALLP